MNHVYEYMKRNGLVTGDRGRDRRTYVELNFFGDVDSDQIPLDKHRGTLESGCQYSARDF